MTCPKCLYQTRKVNVGFTSIKEVDYCDRCKDEVIPVAEKPEESYKKYFSSTNFIQSIYNKSNRSVRAILEGPGAVANQCITPNVQLFCMLGYYTSVTITSPEPLKESDIEIEYWK